VRRISAFSQPDRCTNNTASHVARGGPGTRPVRGRSCPRKSSQRRSTFGREASGARPAIRNASRVGGFLRFGPLRRAESFPALRAGGRDADPPLPDSFCAVAQHSLAPQPDMDDRSHIAAATYDHIAGCFPAVEGRVASTWARSENASTRFAIASASGASIGVSGTCRRKIGAGSPICSRSPWARLSGCCDLDPLEHAACRP